MKKHSHEIAADTDSILPLHQDPPAAAPATPSAAPAQPKTPANPAALAKIEVTLTPTNEETDRLVSEVRGFTRARRHSLNDIP